MWPCLSRSWFMVWGRGVWSIFKVGVGHRTYCWGGVTTRGGDIPVSVVFSRGWGDSQMRALHSAPCVFPLYKSILYEWFLNNIMVAEPTVFWMFWICRAGPAPWMSYPIAQPTLAWLRLFAFPARARLHCKLGRQQSWFEFPAHNAAHDLNIPPTVARNAKLSCALIWMPCPQRFLWVGGNLNSPPTGTKRYTQPWADLNAPPTLRSAQ